MIISPKKKKHFFLFISISNNVWTYILVTNLNVFKRDTETKTVYVEHRNQGLRLKKKKKQLLYTKLFGVVITDTAFHTEVMLLF